MQCAEKLKQTNGFAKAVRHKIISRHREVTQNKGVYYQTQEICQSFAADRTAHYPSNPQQLFQYNALSWRNIHNNDPQWSKQWCGTPNSLPHGPGRVPPRGQHPAGKTRGSLHQHHEAPLRAQLGWTWLLSPLMEGEDYLWIPRIEAHVSEPLPPPSLWLFDDTWRIDVCIWNA